MSNFRTTARVRVNPTQKTGSPLTLSPIPHFCIRLMCLRSVWIGRWPAATTRWLQSRRFDYRKLEVESLRRTGHLEPEAQSYTPFLIRLMCERSVWIGRWPAATTRWLQSRRFDDRNSKSNHLGAQGTLNPRHSPILHFCIRLMCWRSIWIGRWPAATTRWLRSCPDSPIPYFCIRSK